MTARGAGAGIPATCNAAPTRPCESCNVTIQCLVVDDNASFLEAATTLLKREGLEVFGASTAVEALRRTQTLRPDVVLVDIMLGRESGFELARRLVEADSDSPTVILISTHAEADFADLIRQSPAAGFVSKSELSAAAIRRLVDGSARDS
jgi:two-component system, NarL family, nitrate/nitrite response regulator NarL